MGITLASPTVTRQPGEFATRLRRQRRGPWTDTWHRFHRDTFATASLVFLFLLTIGAITASALAPHNPVWSDVREAGVYRKAAWQDDPDPRREGRWAYPLGTDQLGRDVLSRLLYGARVSLVVGIVPIFLMLAVGIPVGLVAGYTGGRADRWLMTVVDLVYAFPAILFFIVLQVTLADTRFGTALHGLLLLFVTLSVLNWAEVARIVRAETLALNERDFVLAARVNGARTGRILCYHVLPNTVGPIVVAAVAAVPWAIGGEAFLSYLGVGLKPTADPSSPLPTSWGQMVLDGWHGWQAQPWLLIAPSLAIGLIMLAATFVGDALRDALDPCDRR